MPSDKPDFPGRAPEPAHAVALQAAANGQLEPVAVDSPAGQLTFGRDALSRLVRDLVAPRLH